MHAAWRKRAEEAEDRATAAEAERDELAAQLDYMRCERDTLSDELRDWKAEVERLKGELSDALDSEEFVTAKLAAERRLKDAAVGALRTILGNDERAVGELIQMGHPQIMDALENFLVVSGLDRATFDELGIAGDGT